MVDRDAVRVRGSSRGRDRGDAAGRGAVAPGGAGAGGVTPAHAVRGPKYVVKKGKTPVLTADEARELVDSIAIARNRTRGSADINERWLFVIFTARMRAGCDLSGLRTRARHGHTSVYDAIITCDYCCHL